MTEKDLSFSSKSTLKKLRTSINYSIKHDNDYSLRQSSRLDDLKMGSSFQPRKYGGCVNSSNESNGSPENTITIGYHGQINSLIKKDEDSVIGISDMDKLRYHLIHAESQRSMTNYVRSRSNSFIGNLS